jgi:hypothetical protein
MGAIRPPATSLLLRSYMEGPRRVAWGFIRAQSLGAARKFPKIVPGRVMDCDSNSTNGGSREWPSQNCVEAQTSPEARL